MKSQWRWLCASLIGAVFACSAEDKDAGKEVQALIVKLKTGTNAERIEAAKTLGTLGAEAKPAVPELVRAFKELNAYYRKHEKEFSDPDLPAEKAAEFDKAFDELGGLYRASLDALGAIGPAAKEAVPALLEEARTGGTAAAQALRTVAPAEMPKVHEWIVLGEMRVFRDIQQEFYERDPDGNGVHDFAKRVHGKGGMVEALSKGEKSKIQIIGFDENTMDGEDLKDQQPPEWGYRYRVLLARSAQGKDKPESFEENGNLTRGYALIAYPFEYGKTGHRTFVLIQIDGTTALYAKDLGEKTAESSKSPAAPAMDSSWAKVPIPGPLQEAPEPGE